MRLGVAIQAAGVTGGNRCIAPVPQCMKSRSVITCSRLTNVCKGLPLLCPGDLPQGHLLRPKFWETIMLDFVEQIAVYVGVLLACFAGPVIATAFLVRRKRLARARRRSPIGIDLLRSPGHSLREKLEEASSDVLADIFMLMVLPLMVLAMSLAQGHLMGVKTMLRLAPVFAGMALLFVAGMVRKLMKAAEQMDKLKAGYDAELAVGQELDQLMRQGAVVFHDMPCENFNVDHVVVAREGVFAVETKGFTKPNRGNGKADATVFYDGKSLKYPAWTTKEPLEQAERQAAWLGKWLSSATGFPIQALPVLALPGWFVERSGRGEVRVYSGRELVGLLRSRGSQPLTAEDVQRIAHQVEQRCRTVAPTYESSTKAT
jgi:hypothetical protein